MCGAAQSAATSFSYNPHKSFPLTLGADDLATRRFKLLYIAPPQLDLDAFPRRVGKLVGNVAKAYGLHGSTLDDLQSAGHARALELMRSFRPKYPQGYEDPDSAFWGWAYREVLTEIQREAARIRAGGTIRSPRRVPGAPVVIARPISDLEDDDGEVNCLPANERTQRKCLVDSQDYRRFLAAAKRLGKVYAQFLSLASKLTDGDHPPTASPADDGGFLLKWSDDRGPQALAIRPDGTFEHKPG